MKKVSIIVPFYNVEEYIERSIKSLVNQSLQDIEIILVNDGSKDGSEEIARDYICFGNPDATVIVVDSTCLEITKEDIQIR